MTRFWTIFLAGLVWLAPVAPVQAQTTVFAAASLREVLHSVADGHAEPVRFSFSGSGTIARQVANGAPVDVVVLASSVWTAWLRNAGHIRADAAKPVATNRLVLIGAQGEPQLETLDALLPRLGDARLAIGQRDAVPAGVYARQWLTSHGLWDDLQNRLAETDNVRSALLLVARGQTPLGVVYATDARADPGVKTLWTADTATHDPIVYWAAALTPTGDSFLQDLLSAQGQAIFADHGFGPAPE